LVTFFYKNQTEPNREHPYLEYTGTYLLFRTQNRKDPSHPISGWKDTMDVLPSPDPNT
jgi:hypothetical protein